MDMIVISHSHGRTWRLAFSPRSPLIWIPVLVLPVAALCGAFFTGYQIARAPSGAQQLAATDALWDRQVAMQSDKITALGRRLEDNLDALTKRLGSLQAQITRLNAVGVRMTQLAGMSGDEFDFDHPPPMGGPQGRPAAQASSLGGFQQALDDLTQQLATRERQMRVLRDLMVAGKLREQVTPSGRPTLTGWISSAFGWRADPFSGNRTFHDGIDFAASLGSDVVSVAAGVVSYAGPKTGYGNLVEINHGNGYTTRYGHNKKILVEVGERIAKGERIATVGSTGRSTGPHVHFEVLRNGRVVNPTAYIQAAR